MASTKQIAPNLKEMGTTRIEDFTTDMVFDDDDLLLSLTSSNESIIISERGPNNKIKRLSFLPDGEDMFFEWTINLELHVRFRNLSLNFSYSESA